MLRFSRDIIVPWVAEYWHFLRILYYRDSFPLEVVDTEVLVWGLIIKLWLNVSCIFGVTQGFTTKWIKGVQFVILAKCGEVIWCCRQDVQVCGVAVAGAVLPYVLQWQTGGLAVRSHYTHQNLQPRHGLCELCSVRTQPDSILETFAEPWTVAFCFRKLARKPSHSYGFITNHLSSNM